MNLRINLLKLSALSIISYSLLKRKFVYNSTNNTTLYMQEIKDNSKDVPQLNNSINKEDNNIETNDKEDPIKKLIKIYYKLCPDIVRLAIEEDLQSDLSHKVIARNEDDYNNYKGLYSEYIKLNKLNVNSSKENNNSYKNQISNSITPVCEKDNLTFLKTIIINLSNILDNYIEEIDIQVSRNIKGYNFSPLISNKERQELKTTIIKAIKNREKEVFQIKSSIDDEYPDSDVYSEGKFFKVSTKYIDYPDKFPVLKKYGVYNEWPEHRIIYKNIGGITVLINDEDHIKFKFNYSKSNKDNDNIQAGKSLYLLYDLIQTLEKDLKYAFSQEFGYLTTLPCNSGNAVSFYIKAKINNNKDNKNLIFKELDTLNKNYNNNILIDFSDNIDNNCCYLNIVNSSTMMNFSNILIMIMNIKSTLADKNLI